MQFLSSRSSTRDARQCQIGTAVRIYALAFGGLLRLEANGADVAGVSRMDMGRPSASASWHFSRALPTASSPSDDGAFPFAATKALWAALSSGEGFPAGAAVADFAAGAAAAGLAAGASAVGLAAAF